MTSTDAPIADRVIVAVFDGLRPDMVTPEYTPNILRLAERGTWFREARSVFPSVTRVATTAIATGAPPSIHGIVGNTFYHPAVMAERTFDTSRADHIRRAEEFHGSRFVSVDTLGDVLARAGKKLAVVHTGSAGSGHLINPRAKANGHWTFSMHGRDGTQTPEAFDDVVAHMGPLPERTLPRLAELQYAGELMASYVLPKLAPDVALVWFNEPDTTYHYKGLGSPEAIAGLKEADKAFGVILDWVDAQPDAERIVVIVASDHGQISTRAIHPLFEDAAASGFDIGIKDAINGSAFVATGGMSGEIRLIEGDRSRLDSLATWLMEQPAVGHLFSRDRNGIEGQIGGTLSLDLMGNGHAERQPDLMFVLQSDLSNDQFGLPGLGTMIEGDVPLGGGMHGGINRHELNTVLIVGTETYEGRGNRSSAPAGIIDVTPTVLGLLGLPRSQSMRGRDLTDAPYEESRTTRHSAGSSAFVQHVDIVEQDGRSFIVGGGH